MSVRTELWEGDPFLDNLVCGEREGKGMFVAGIGVEVATRRRNKFAGKLVEVRRGKSSRSVEFDLVVNEAIGECPKYITVRQLVPFPKASPKVVHKRPIMSEDDRLAEDAISFILSSDTVFLGTTYSASPNDARVYPSHVGMNHRGGRPGFIRVRPSDGRTIVLPDFSGNRIMTSLGNIEATPLASLTFVNFTTGDVLYVTGNATNLVGPESQVIMPFQNTLTKIYVTGYTLILDALPCREDPASTIQPSPYSPPIRFLAEEKPSSLFNTGKTPMATLLSIDMHSATIATFTWESSEELVINPGQCVILDFTTLFGSREYQHMAPTRPSSVNDDFIRTWTVSSAAKERKTRMFSLTMREKPGGTVTGALFSLARSLRESKRNDMREMAVAVKVAGVMGEFCLPTSPRTEEGSVRKMVWIAGGIGVTPFLSMLRAVLEGRSGGWDITLILSMREPEVILPLVFSILEGAPDAVNEPTFSLAIYVFSKGSVPTLAVKGVGEKVRVETHLQRLSKEFLVVRGKLLVESEVYVCGPGTFEKVVLEVVAELGGSVGDVRREGFEF